MGIVNRVKEDFYQPISREHVLLLCALDVDSLCACKILQSMLKVDSVPHTIMPVAGKADLKRTCDEHTGQINSVVLINCGGYLNLLELIQPDNRETRFYIIDSHRPLELDNVYNQDQIVVVVREEDELDVPEYDTIYSSDKEEDDSDEEYFSDEDGGPGTKRRRSDKDSYETRRKKHLWRRKRDEIMYKYYEFNYHETAASLVLYELACKLNRDSNELVWLAITGLTEQLLHEKIDRERYVTDLHKLQPNVLRHNRSDETRPSAINSMKISFESELRLVLYRHWTLYESLCHSEYTVCRFKVWTQKGHKKLQEFLANMGIPLVQSKQQFNCMDTRYSDNLMHLIDESAHKFQLDDMTYTSFVARWGYKSKLSASDMVYSCTALMTEADKPHAESFLTALEALSRSSVQLTNHGLELAKQQQVAIVEQVRNLVDTRVVSCMGTLVCANVAEGTPNVKNFANPLTLLKLARFLREYYIVKNKKARDLPFIVTAPLDLAKGVCLMVGVPPHSDDTRRSEFAKAFQHAADRILAHASFDHFDGSVIELRQEEILNFLGALVSISAL